MREILFRGKELNTGKWIEGDLIHSLGRTYCGYYAETLGQVDPISVGEYTGIKDAKGLRIFEGDIVAAHLDRLNPSDTTVCFVAWNDFAWRICQPGCSPDMLESYDYGTWTVIGNIHDNPELLENAHERISI